jgi:hypothetical protein
MPPFTVSEGTGSAGSTQSGADSEHYCGGKRYQGKQDRRPGHQGCYATGNQGRNRRVDGIHEPQPTTHEVSCEDESGYSSGDGYK